MMNKHENKDAPPQPIALNESQDISEEILPKKHKRQSRGDSAFNIVVETKGLIMPLKSYVNRMHKDSMVDPTGGAIITQDGNFSNTGSNTNSNINTNMISSVTNVASATATASSQASMIDSVTKSNQALAIKYEDLEFGDELGREQFGSVSILRDLKMSNDSLRIENTKSTSNEFMQHAKYEYLAQKKKGCKK